MSTLAVPTLYAQVRPRSIRWLMLDVERSELGRGRCADFEALRAVQVRAGLVAVVVGGELGDWSFPASLAYGGEWRAATVAERRWLAQQLETKAAA
jgi:hypothetical protein